MKWKYGLMGVALVAILGVAYYGLSPLFITLTADEALPTSSSSSDGTDEDSADNTMVSTEAATVTGTVGHPASGTARIVSVDGKNYLRYENLETINGPDLFIYLAKGTDGKEFVNLGRLRATKGNVNYEIPDDVDPKDYPYALTWCKAFSVLFNSAKVN